jgi:hypothetical protein
MEQRHRDPENRKRIVDNLWNSTLPPRPYQSERYRNIATGRYISTVVRKATSPEITRAGKDHRKENGVNKTQDNKTSL